MSYARLAVFAVTAFALTGSWLTPALSFDRDDPYPCLDDEQDAVEEALDEYKGAVHDCLRESTNLSEARQCWDVDDT